MSKIEMFLLALEDCKRSQRSYIQISTYYLKREYINTNSISRRIYNIYNNV